jgi:hypothetical protein
MAKFVRINSEKGFVPLKLSPSGTREAKSRLRVDVNKNFALKTKLEQSCVSVRMGFRQSTSTKLQVVKPIMKSGIHVRESEICSR